MFKYKQKLLRDASGIDYHMNCGLQVFSATFNIRVNSEPKTLDGKQWNKNNIVLLKIIF